MAAAGLWCLVIPVLIPAGADGATVVPPNSAQAAVARTAADLARGKQLFEAQCARCHGMQGRGGTGANLRRPVLRNAGDDLDLFSVVQHGIPGTAMPGNWFLSDREIWQVVRYVRSLGRAATEVIPGDPDKGKLVFERAQCTKCHIVDGRGGTSGPELSGIADRRGLEALREAVVFPEKQLPLDASGYQAYRVVLLATTEGRLLTGLRINEDTFTIQLRDDASQLHSLRKHELNELRKTEGSWMPSYEKLLSSTEIEDLVSFLARLKGKP